MNTCDEVRVSAAPANTITSVTRMRTMDELTIRYCSIDEIEHAPNIEALMAEYAEEAHNPELPSPNAQFEQYRKLQEIGMLGALGAFMGEELIGFVGVIRSVMPHHGATLAMTESFFVAKAHRKGGAGLKLLRAAEQHAKEVGSPCLLVSTVHGSVLEKIMPSLGYRHCNSSFVRSLA